MATSAVTGEKASRSGCARKRTAPSEARRHGWPEGRRAGFARRSPPSTRPRRARKKTELLRRSSKSSTRSRYCVAEQQEQTEELIVTFRRGISEDIARAAVKGAGGNVRRRMRTDYPNEVQLLVRASP